MLKLPDRNAWNAGMPFPLAVTQWPWNPRLLAETVAAWPADDDPHWVPHRSGKRSYGVRDGTVPQQLRPILDKLHSPEFLRALEEMTGIGGLVCDPTLEGGGLHETAPGGRLGMHVDFNRLGTLHRRLNVLVYLNPIVPDNSGDLRLESDDGKDVRRVPPRMGTMVVFGTTDRSWHGQPSPLTWDFSRRSFAVYYYTADPPPKAAKAHSTIYRGEEKHKGAAMEVRPKPTRIPVDPQHEMIAVTTFNQSLYNATGRRLVESWLLHGRGQHAPLVCCTEGDIQLPQDESLIRYRLEEDVFLSSWLAANADVIPVCYGGTATPCGCRQRRRTRRGPRRVQHDVRHDHACHWTPANRMASKWFRKVAAVRAAVVLAPAKRLLWLDSDVMVRRQFTLDDFDAMLGGQAMFHLLGARESIESGVYGILPGASPLVDELTRLYADGRYRKLARWDDGYAMAHLVRTGKASGRDLVGRRKIGHVLPDSPLSRFFRHDKGVHKRSGLHASELEGT